MRQRHLPEPVAKVYACAKKILARYSDDNGSLMAAAVSFFAFLSLIPLALLAIAVFGFVLGSTDQAQQMIVGVLGANSVGPGVDNIVKQVIQDRGAATGFGILVFLWSGSTMIVTLEMAMNHIWNVEERRSYVTKRLISFAVLVILVVLLGLSFAMTAAITAIRSHNLIPWVLDMGWFWDLLTYLVPLAITIVTFTLFYEILPNTKVPRASAFAGGLLAGLLWEAAKYAFSYYVANVANYNQIYGSLGGIILLLLWIYYSSIIVIYGAELASIRADAHPDITNRS
ncbi:MAG: YihY/virulence factor BrkB family protein [Armatimonadota bacterium]|nr:YihY/virulence factor BrkB family protein [bacterium]